ncbi:unnamed protein product, partial [Laminaria digitata]
MERRPPSSARPRIPGGYGNYPGRDPESPVASERSMPGGGQKKRPQAPWGGLFQGQEDVTLPTAPWEAGAPLHGRDDELQQEQWRSQAPGQSQGQYQAAAWARGGIGPGGIGAAPGGYGGGGGGGSTYAGSEAGGRGGRSEAALSVQGFNTDREGMSSRGYRSPPHRRRASPLVGNAPRLTLLSPLASSAAAGNGGGGGPKKAFSPTGAAT